MKPYALYIASAFLFTQFRAAPKASTIPASPTTKIKTKEIKVTKTKETKTNETKVTKTKETKVTKTKEIKTHLTNRSPVLASPYPSRPKKPSTTSPIPTVFPSSPPKTPSYSCTGTTAGHGPSPAASTIGPHNP